MHSIPNNMVTMRQYRNLLFIAAVSVSLYACKGGNEQKERSSANAAEVQAPKVSTPSFDADTAYSDVSKQVSFGPRTPGSAAQRQCADWMAQRLKNVCDTVYRQNVMVTGGKGKDAKQLPCMNVIGVINPKAQRRILLLTHWDSRPWADQDTKDKDKPILAADDGGSGVAVLIEMAKELKKQGLSADLGIDILFTDVEDYGRTEWGENSYCLGTQYWANHPHVAGYKASFGILLDMVGAHGAQFPLEGLSAQFAAEVQQSVWHSAANAGYGAFFPFEQSAAITDDHVPVNQITGIKTIDIINLTSNPESPFAAHWHTHADNMDIIDRNTLKAVGQTLLQVIYEAAANVNKGS